MPKIQIKRFITGPDGTFGVLLINDKPVCVTLEETWDPKKEKITGSDTAITAGTYQVEAYSGTKFKNVFLLKDVPGRSAVLIHWGNTEDNTAGCILLGRSFQKFGEKYGIDESQITYAKIRAMLPKAFKLEIINAF